MVYEASTAKMLELQMEVFQEQLDRMPSAKTYNRFDSPRKELQYDIDNWLKEINL